MEMKGPSRFSLAFLITALSPVAAFVPHQPFHLSPVTLLGSLFEEDPEMIEVAEHYIRSKYRSTAKDHGHDGCNKEDVTEVLRVILPPVTPEELYKEVNSALKIIMQNPEDDKEIIDEDLFVKTIVKNSYWEEAGDLVVKELIYFDTLYHFYHTDQALLNNDDYEELKDNLTWEGSSVATMNQKEALFVTAVAAARRCEPIMDDTEYKALKAELKDQNSWVVNRKQDALERIKLQTFMGYLHRSLAAKTDFDCVG